MSSTKERTAPSIDHIDVSEPPNVPTGTYVGTFTGIEARTSEYGPSWRWSFEVIGPEGETVVISTLTSQKLNNQTNAWQIVRALLGHEPEKRVDIAGLVGAEVSLQLSLKEDGWNKVERLSAYRRNDEPLPPEPGEDELSNDSESK